MVDPFVVAAPSGARIRTSLRVSEHDDQVLWQVGSWLGSLAGEDLARRCAAGAGPKHAGRTDRKRMLTERSSSRWAGAITRTSADQWERARSNQFDEARSLRRALLVLDARIAAPVAGRAGRTRGYATPAERFAKQRRRQHLAARLARLEAEIAAGRVHVVRGGNRLAHLRHHLDDADLTETEWLLRWRAARLFLTADGEADKLWGNETIRVHPDDGSVEIRLPSPLAHLSNTPGRAPTYRLSSPVMFRHRRDEWAAQVASGAVRYDITFDPDRCRWHLDASWTTTPTPAPDIDQLRRSCTLGVDVNADHLAAWVVDPSGNPTGPPHTIPLRLDGDTARRDGQLRAAITELVDIAAANGCASISIENLNFADARTTGRETLGRGRRGKQFRRTIANIPTARFRARLVAMAHNRGLHIIAVDPAYTSRWGAQHWQPHLTIRTPVTTRHHAAAVVIARRSQRHSARRRARHTSTVQRNAAGQRRLRPDTNRTLHGPHHRCAQTGSTPVHKTRLGHDDHRVEPRTGNRSRSNR